MRRPPLSKHKAHSISNGIFLVSLGILILTGLWWPGIILAIWATMASRQYLSGRIYYASLTTFVFIALFFLALLKFDFDILAPVLLVVAGIFLIVKEYYSPDDTDGEEKSEEIIEDAELDGRNK